MRTIPPVIEGFNFGMNNYESPKNLTAGMYQLLLNTFPGISIEPRNGIYEDDEDSVALGAHEGAEHSTYRPESCYIEAGGKEFVFCWHKAKTTTDYFSLEVWNMTDDNRTVLIKGDFNETDVHFSMVKLYEAIYMTLDYEIVTNPNSSYRTKNKIIEWDSTNSAWAVREMGIDVAGEFDSPQMTDIAGTEFGAISNHRIVRFSGLYWLYGGRDSDGNANQKILNSSDGKTWTYRGILSFAHTIGFSVIVIPADPTPKIIIIGGETSGGTKSNAVYSSTNGTSFGAENNFTNAISWHTCLYYDHTIWVIGGIVGSTYEDNVHYSTDEASTWTDRGNVLSVGVAHHTSVVFDEKMWLIAGVGAAGVESNDVFYSTDGTTWSTATAAAAFGAIYDHSSIVFNNKMWVFCGFDGTATYNDSAYYSTDGVTWTLGSAAMGISDERSAACVFLYEEDNKLMLSGGEDAGAYYNDLYESENGSSWVSADGLGKELYYSYASTFVRRTDSYAKLGAVADYVFFKWANLDGDTIVGPDEKLLTGTVAVLAGGTVTGTSTAFDTELAVDDEIRVDGATEALTVLTITNATSMTVDANWGYSAGSEFSLLPTLNDVITTKIFQEGDVESITDIDKRKVIYSEVVTADTVQVFLPIADSSVILDVVAQGATHQRFFRTLGSSNKTIAKGLHHRFVCDVAITGDAYVNTKLFVDTITNNALSGQTNILEMTGYSVPPLGRFSIWAGQMLWIGGDPDNPGYWFHSVKPGTAGVSFNTQFPQKFASMFNLKGDFVTCDPADGQKDTGCALLAGDLYLFKQRKIFVVYNADPTNIPVRISNTIGCACPFTIRNAEVPILGGTVIFFISESGPAYIGPGGKVKLLFEFGISQLYPDCNLKVHGSLAGVLTNSDGSSTTWYTRNKVSSAFWKNTWWILYGDSEDSTCELTENKVFGFQFNKLGVGALECKFLPWFGSPTIASQSDVDTTRNKSYSVGVDTVKKILFLCNYDDGLHTFTYDAAGTLTHVDNDDLGSNYLSIAVDTTNLILIIANGASGIRSYTYDAAGNVTYVDTDSTPNNAEAVCIDISNKIIFVASQASTLTFTYDVSGNITAVDANTTYNSGLSIAVDTTNSLLFVGHYVGAWTFSYDNSGNLTYISSVNTGTRVEGITLDVDKKLVFFGNYKSGLYVYKYTKFGKFSSLIDSDDQGAQAYRLDIDTTNQLIFLANDDRGMEIYYYDDNGFLSHVQNIDKGVGKYMFGVVVDTTNKIVFLAYWTEGTFSYTYINRIYEPQVLIPVDNNAAYTLSHKDHYGLARFLKPNVYQDTFLTAGAISYYQSYQTRFLYVGPRRNNQGTCSVVIIYIKFDGTAGSSDLVITLNLDKDRLRGIANWSQTRESGMSDTDMDKYRNFIHAFTNDLLKRKASFFDIKVEKKVPVDGNVEMSGHELGILEGEGDPEFHDAFADPTGSITFVVESDSSPEVDAHA